MRGGRSHRAINMHFGEGPNSGSLTTNNNSNPATGVSATSVRDPMDPIAGKLLELNFCLGANANMEFLYCFASYVVC